MRLQAKVVRFAQTVRRWLRIGQTAPMDRPAPMVSVVDRSDPGNTVTGPSTFPTTRLVWFRDLVGHWSPWAVGISSGSHRGSAAAFPDAPPDIRVAYTPQLALHSEWVRGADGSYALRLKDGWSAFASSTGAPARTGSSTSTATPSKGSHPSVVDS